MAVITKENQLTATKGTFEARGKLFNVKSERAFSVNDKGNWRTCNLGLRIADGEVLFFQVKGGPKQEVYLSKQSDKKGEKPETKKVSWDDRFKAQKNGFRMMGVNLGLVKGDDGKNEITSLTEWDAWDYLKENAKDDMSVFISGDIEFSSYEKDGEIKKMKNLIAKKIYLATDEIDFQSEKFEKKAGFSQTGIIVGRHKEAEQFYLEIGYVGWATYEVVDLECTQVIYDILAKNVKPFNALTLTGVIKTSQNVDKVSDEVWGEKSDVGVPKSTAKTVLFVTGARPDTIDKETYTNKIVDNWLDLVERSREEKKNKETKFATQSGGGDGDSAWGEKGGATTEEDLPW